MIRLSSTISSHRNASFFSFPLTLPESTAAYASLLTAVDPRMRKPLLRTLFLLEGIDKSSVQ